jgi:serine/threonine protein kinase/tetratricopeptide (TPR) repeat protein
MSDAADPFPDIDAAGALRSAFKRRDSTLGSSPREAVPMRAYESKRISYDGERASYEIEGEIARGGMGVVVKAFDRELTRDVALKVLRDEFRAEPRHVRRFIEEARVTARLDHPGIVPVHQVGRDAEGRAYFAMRLVRGRDLRRIIQLANANEEGWNQPRALSVILKVCEAMAYAHERGVIHRDLKPSNVMVGEFGEVYVMDWGLARVLGESDSHDLRLRRSADASIAARDDRRPSADVDSPIVTMDGEVLGTPCYMSPEQAQGRLAELGPRSDVYSVGALLYHLLAGEMPYVPSGTSLASRAVLAELAKGPPRALNAVRADVPAELIAICEKAMTREPRDRYPDMRAMAEDLRAFLERRVVAAYETGAWAEARKWVARNRALALSLASIAVALIAGLAVSLVLEAKAETSRLHAEESARAAKSERDKAEKIASFLEDTLRGATPSVAAGRDTTMLREMMDAAAARIEHGELAGVPEAEARLLIMVAGAYRELAQFDKAEGMLRRALEELDRSAEHDDLRAAALTQLGLILAEQSDFSAAEPMLREALDIDARIHPGDSAIVASHLANLAALLRDRGDRAASEALLRRALAMNERVFQGDREEIATAETNLAVVLDERGDTDGAEALHTQAMAMRERLYRGDHPALASSLDSLGHLRYRRGDLENAETFERRALEMRRRVYSADHPLLSASIDNLAGVVAARGDLAEAEKLYREALAMRRRMFAGDQDTVARSMMNLAAILDQRGQSRDAEPLYRDALAMQRRLFPGDHPEIPNTLHNLAVLVRNRGELAEAEALLREALDMQRRVSGCDDDAVAWITDTLASVAFARGEFAAAEDLQRDVLAIRRCLYPHDHIDVGRGARNLALALEKRGELVEAESLDREALAIFRAVSPESSPFPVLAEFELGRVLHERGELAEADETLARAAERLAQRTDRTGGFYPECLELLVANSDAWERADPRRGHADRALEWRAKLAENEK